MFYFKKKFLNQNGQFAVIIAVLIVSLFGMTALVVDVGSLYHERRNLQSVADSAALAGAQELPDDTDKAIQVAIDYASKHGVSISSGDVKLSNALTSNDTITVTSINPGKETYFAGVLEILDPSGESDFSEVEVTAQATAMIAKPLEVAKIVPWGIDIDTFLDLKFRDLVQFYFSTIDEIGPGNFGALDLPRKDKGGGGANDYYDNILYGYNKLLKVGDIIDTKPGKMPEKTEENVSKRVNILGDGKDKFNDIVIEYPIIKNDTQVVYLPVMSINEKPNGKFEITILDFAILVLTDWGKVGKEAWVEGQFIEKAITKADGSVGAVEEKGLRVIRLIK